MEKKAGAQDSSHWDLPLKLAGRRDERQLATQRCGRGVPTGTEFKGGRACINLAYFPGV